MDYETGFEELKVVTSLGNIYLKHHKGSKQKLLFLHGFGISSTAWRRLVALLPEDLDVYLMDLLGHGKSDAPDIIYGIDKQVVALKDVVQKLGLEDSYIVGHSYGGWAVLLYVITGGKAQGIVLEDAAGVKDGIDKIRDFVGKEVFNERMLKSAMRYTGNKEFVMKSILSMEFQNPNFDATALSKIALQTLIIWGSEDKLIDTTNAQILRDNINGSMLDMVEGAGHEPHYTNPENVKNALLRFIGYI